MHQAIPYRSWHFTTPLPLIAHSHSHDDDKKMNNNNSSNIDDDSSSLVVSPKKLDKEGSGRMVVKMVSENAVIVIGRRGCCMSHVVKRLLLGLGVNPAVYEIEETDEATVATTLLLGKVQFPAVFIGGKLFGGLERIMATHISGDLVPILKQAGALWL